MQLQRYITLICYSYAVMAAIKQRNNNNWIKITERIEYKLF